MKTNNDNVSYRTHPDPRKSYDLFEFHKESPVPEFVEMTIRVPVLRQMYEDNNTHLLGYVILKDGQITFTTDKPQGHV